MNLFMFTECVQFLLCLLMFFFLIGDHYRGKKKTLQNVRPRFFITGDKHRHFDGVAAFCRKNKTNKRDVLIVLGDAGLNYYGDERDDKLKERVANLNITLLCLHGNKENRPQNVGTYGLRNFCGGKVYYEPRFPNLLFARDGEIYLFEGKKYMVVGGAHSVDKIVCLEEGRPYWDDEMPDEKVKTVVEKQLAGQNDTVYGLLTHTCPLSYLPTEMFVSTRRINENKRKPKKARRKRFKPDVDRSTEEWLDILEQRLDYQVWYCGHYHVDKEIDKICMMHQEIRLLHPDVENC